MSAGYLLTITATFSEPIKGSASLFPPLLSIDYNGNFNDEIHVLMVQDPNTPDSTVWIYEAVIPPNGLLEGSDNSGVATVTVIASDRSGNELNIEDISYTDTLFVDNKFLLL